MKASNKSRRSPRIPARHNVMLIVDGAEGASTSKEVVTTVHISQHGAHLVARRRLNESSKGKVAHLSTCRQAAFRIAWQAASTSQPGYHDIGIEFEGLTDFWGTTYEEAKSTERSTQPTPSEDVARASNAATSTAEVLDLLRTVPSSPEGRDITDALWCGLVAQLEERRVITRAELIASLREIGLAIQ
jgi:hypothetical protein